MTAIIHYVRHGENPANLTREFSHKRVDYSLTERGMMQARQTARYFLGKPIAAVYTSPLKRAYETSKIIASELGLGVTQIERFREVNVGVLEGQPPTDELWAFHDRIFADWLHGDSTVRFPGGEDHTELLARMKAGLAYVAERHFGQETVVVAHGGILNATINSLCPETPVIHPSHIPNCSVTTLEVSIVRGNLRCHLHNWANCSHLS